MGYVEVPIEPLNPSTQLPRTPAFPKVAPPLGIVPSKDETKGRAAEQRGEQSQARNTLSVRRSRSLHHMSWNLGLLADP